MSEQAMEDMPAEEAPAVDVDLKAVESCIADVRARDKARAWRSAERLQLGDVAWTPDAIGEKNAVLQVALIGDLPRYLRSRLRAAHANGHVVHVAISTAVLYAPEWLDLLV